MSEWSDFFFKQWREAWNTRTEDIMDLVTDDIEYWDPTLAEPITNIQDYAVRLDRFFSTISEASWTLRSPVIFDEEEGRASESWAFTGVNTGDLWTGHKATGRRVETIGTDVFEFRDGQVCKQYSYFDVLESLRQFGLQPAAATVERETIHASLAIGPGKLLQPAEPGPLSLALKGRRALSKLPIPGASLLAI